MQSILDFVELGGLLGLAFSIAVVIEWALLRAIFRGIAVGLRPAAIQVQEIDSREPGR
jgi:hypothetical protein